MKYSAYLAGFAVLIALGAVPACWAASVSGEVRDSAGVPQIGAVVQLLRPDLSVVTSVYTNSKGQFDIASVVPGRYALKAMGMSFLPSLRENVRVRRGTIVNLTLNTLYEVMQWLPAQPRDANAQKDDWTWTLRSAANRPLLRWLENGPLMVVTDGPGATPKLQARLMATGQAGTFGESGQRFSATVEDTPANSRELLARVDFAPGTDARMESMLGFRQDLGFAGSVQSIAAVAIHPEVGCSGGFGLDEAAVRSSETMRLGYAIQAEAGSTEAMGRLGGQSSGTVIQGLPFASIEWSDGNSAVTYRMATMVENPESNDEAEAATWLPEFSARNGELVLEHGLHQEIGWQRRTDASGMTVLVYTDTIENPVLEAMGHFAQDGSTGESMATGMLFDPTSGLLRAAGPDFSAAGIQASFERIFSGGNRIRLSYANGNALVMPALPQATALSQVLESAQPRHVQTYAIALSGTLDGTHTHWRASYRWQPDGAVTEVAPFAVDAIQPYFNLRFSQPIHLTRDGSGGIEALLEVRNLLAEGYRPYILSDGSVLIFAEDQRSFRGGLAFTF
jgi:hypothetical protein